MELIQASSNLESAFSSKPEDWHSINWVRVNRNVKEMQIKLVKFCREGDWRTVKAMQRSLTRSFSGRCLAVRRVTENQGKNTAGVDGELWKTPELKWLAISRLKQHGYRPKPLRRVYIPKSNGKKRPLGIPTMLDRAMQALHLMALEPIAEAKADPDSYGFRQGRSTADAMGQLFVSLSNKHSANWVLDADIKGCFDNIRHDWLIDNVPMNKSILQKWLKSGVVFNGRFANTEAGTPQGGIISPTLANLTLDGLETGLKNHLGELFGKTRSLKLKVNIVRYADDFVITSESKDLLETTVLPWIVQFLSQRGLELSMEKTRITHIDDGFDFLGWNFRKYAGKMFIKPSKKNAQAFYKKLKEVVKSNMAVKQEVLIYLLNPILKGWANYHSPVVAKQTYSRLDNLLWYCLWRWAKRRHPNKPKIWVRAKYWHRLNDREMFSAPVEQADGKTSYLSLYKLADTVIKRHVKIKGEYNPFDPEWESYGEKRRNMRLMNNIKHIRKQVNLWHEQDGLCALCRLPLTEESGWHMHHIIQRVAGGADTMDNLVLLHPNCHAQVHSKGLFVGKVV
ncbi:group II intron reverse transcriptase/maturase [Advenella sp. RU8]|uniref:group II intron reverse transcriptase/maturase n=1 Tax=Advenella sp. RU8 TaxID=3399575 RepID=UPI003AAA98E1